jgi:hypothetical protein
MAMEPLSARSALSDALRYWEPRRLAYNAILAAEVAAIYFAQSSALRPRFQASVALMIFVLAVLANVAYCAAYLVDVPVQLTTFRESWLRFRWCLALLGTAFAAALTYFFSSGLIG